MTISHICVFCGSNAVDNPAYIHAARELGKMIALAGKKLVYGGGGRGLMGILAREARENGAYVIGVIPQRFSRYSQDFGIDERILVDTMHERKEKMFSLSQAFIILPGGIGTLDEFSEIFTLLQIGLSNEPVILLNINGYYDSLIAFFDRMTADGFLMQSQRDLLFIRNNPEDILGILENYVAPHEIWKQP